MITVYSATGCSKCAVLKSMLKNLKVDFKEVNIFNLSDDEIEKIGIKGIPTIDFNGAVALAENWNKEKIKNFLGLK